MNRPLSPALAFAVAAAGIGLFSIMDAFMKSLTLAMGVYNALIWRTGMAAILGAVPWIAGGARRPSRRGMSLHLIRGGVTAAMALSFFWGLARVPMAQAITLSYIAPLLALLLGAMFLHERVGRRVVTASLAAFAGVLVVLAGQSHAAQGAQALEGAAWRALSSTRTTPRISSAGIGGKRGGTRARCARRFTTASAESPARRQACL